MTTCATCGDEVREEAAFCTSCGTPVAAAPEPTSTEGPVATSEATPAPSTDPWAVPGPPPGGPVPPTDGVPPGGPPSGGSSGKGKVLALVVGAVVLLLLAGGGLALALAGGGDEDDGEDAAATTTTTEAEEPVAEDEGGDAGEGDEERGDGEDAAEEDEEEREEFTDPGFDGAASVSLFDLQVGHCVEEDLGFLFGAVGELTLVDCATPHRAEMYHRFDLPDGPYPGDAGLEAAGDACYGTAFSDYVGVSWDYSQVYASYFTPDQEAWELGGVRTVMCFAHELDTSATSTVSVRNSGR